MSQGNDLIAHNLHSYFDFSNKLFIFTDGNYTLNVMKRLLITLLAVFALHGGLQAQPPAELLTLTKEHPALSWGGCDVIEVEGVQYIVAVASVDVGTKKMPQLRTIGITKAKRELLLTIKGSTVSSTTEMTTSEVLTTVGDKQEVVTKESFFESIRESADGFVSGMAPLGVWYSSDRSLFFAAIYKQINL